MERQDLNGVRTPMDVQRRMKNKQVEENTKTINKIVKEQIHIDSALSSSSTNPVQNKIIAQKFNEYTETANLASVATSGDYTDLSNTPTIPDELADLTDDSTHRLVTDTEKTTWNAKSDFSGSYTDLTDKPTIPDELADLSDDSTHRLVTDTEKSTWNGKQDELVSGTNIKTINNTSILGSGDISIGGGGSATDVQVNGTSITSGGVANIETEGTYDSSTNKISTMSDITGITGLLTSLLTTDTTNLVNAINEVRGLAIVESGNNANGRYIKFSNGIMICWSTFNRTFIATTASGSLYRGTINIGSTPATFTLAPTVFAVPLELNFLPSGISSISTTSYGTLTFYMTGSTGSSGYGGYVRVFAIGMWK